MDNSKQNNITEVNQPLVSIGVPVYNGGKYINECLESIKLQTYKNWECIIINNCSSDDTPKIAENYTKMDNRFKLVHTDNLLPMADNWNFCFSQISPQAKYFKIVPADDWLFSNYLEEMLNLMEKNPTIGICSSYRIDDKYVDTTGMDYYSGNIYKGKDIIVGEFTRKIYGATGSVNSVLFKIEYLKKLPSYPEIYNKKNIHLDTELAYDVLNISDFGFIFKILSYTRRHNETSTSFAKRYRTYIFGREMILFKYKHIDPLIQKRYNKLRLGYAYFIFRKFVCFDWKILKWHKKHLPRKFTIKEYFLAILYRVIFGKIK